MELCVLFPMTPITVTEAVLGPVFAMCTGGSCGSCGSSAPVQAQPLSLLTNIWAVSGLGVIPVDFVVGINGHF